MTGASGGRVAPGEAGRVSRPAIHYTPDIGRAGDTIPFFDGTRWHVFYLREVERGITSWFHLVSDDGARWNELGEAIGVGAADDQDASVATGSIIERDGVYHAFYTGFSFARKSAGLPEQGILRATSTDLLTWTKDAAFETLNADPVEYDAHDWRDPFVFWNEDAGAYWMLLAGQRRTGPLGRRGVVVRYVSDDLDRWRLVDPLWEPCETPMHECPDLFREGDWWYLVYSTFNDRQVTRYRMSRSIEGPWIAPADDVLDDAGLYAAKSMTDGERRLLVGWVPTRHPASDDGAWAWGGTIVTHELRQRGDGTLAVVVPEAVRRAAGPCVPAEFEPRRGTWERTDDAWRVDAADGFAWAWLGALPETGSVRLELTPERGVFEIGLGFRVDDRFDAGYLVRLRPELGRLEFDRFPRVAHAGLMHERPVPIGVGRPAVVDLVWDGQTVVVNVDGVALTARTYRPGGGLVCFVQQGVASFRLDASPR